MLSYYTSFVVGTGQGLDQTRPIMPCPRRFKSNPHFFSDIIITSPWQKLWIE
jgi:hypothetical protein